MANSNWIFEKNEEVKKSRKTLKDLKKSEIDKEFIYVPHPTIPKTMIRKEIKK